MFSKQKTVARWRRVRRGWILMLRWWSVVLDWEAEMATLTTTGGCRVQQGTFWVLCPLSLSLATAMPLNSKLEPSDGNYWFFLLNIGTSLENTGGGSYHSDLFHQHPNCNNCKGICWYHNKINCENHKPLPSVWGCWVYSRVYIRGHCTPSTVGCTGLTTTISLTSAARINIQDTGDHLGRWETLQISVKVICR